MASGCHISRGAKKEKEKEKKWFRLVDTFEYIQTRSCLYVAVVVNIMKVCCHCSFSLGVFVRLRMCGSQPTGIKILKLLRLIVTLRFIRLPSHSFDIKEDKFKFQTPTSRFPLD